MNMDVNTQIRKFAVFDREFVLFGVFLKSRHSTGTGHWVIYSNP